MRTFKEVKEEYLKTPEEDIIKRGRILLIMNELQETSEEVKIFWGYLGSFPKNPTSVC